MAGVRTEGSEAVLRERDRRWAVVCTHQERLLRIARSRVDNLQDAEDCVQEAMVRCVEFADLDDARLGQFLTSVTIRLCADVHRKRQRGDRLSRRLTAYVTIEPGPEEDICDRAESAWLSTFLESLSPRQRAIVEARAAGLSCRAVAERASVSSNAVESVMARVRRSLRVALESSLGVVLGPVRWVRTHPAAAGALTVSAAAAVTLGFAPAELVHRTPAPRVEALRATGSEGVHSRAAGRVEGTRPVARTTTVVPEARPDAAVLGGGGGHGDHGQKVADVGVGGNSGGVYQNDEGPSYTPAERAGHCARYGVSIGEAVQCRYPPGDPRNQPEEAGTPPLPIP